MKLKWGDFLVFIIITTIISVMFISGASVDSSETLSAQISIDGQLLYEIDLNTLSEAQEIYLKDGHIKITAEQGRIRFEHSDCSDQVCVHTGWISRRGQIAACLPNKTLIKIVGKSSEIDVVLN